jgi:hypothetical protein
MSTLTITAKGQVTLRKDFLEHLGVRPGEKITVDKLPSRWPDYGEGRAAKGQHLGCFQFPEAGEWPVVVD